MNELERICEQFRLFSVQHLPPEVMTHAVLTAIGVLALGVAISVFGAKLARWGITGAFVLLGAVVGAYFAGFAGFPAIPCALITAAMVGVIGAVTHRLWVGVMTSVVLSAIVLGAFGYQKVVPQVAAFDPMTVWSAADGQSGFNLPTPQEQEMYRDRTPSQWFHDFWTFVGERDANVPRHGKALALGAGVVGLFIGVLAARFTLILSTAFIGTLLVTGSLATLGTHLMPGLYQAGFRHPGVVGLGVGAFLVTSLILQTMLTRNTSSKSKSPQPSDKS